MPRASSGKGIVRGAQILALVQSNLAMATASSSLKLSFSPGEKEMLKWPQSCKDETTFFFFLKKSY